MIRITKKILKLLSKRQKRFMLVLICMMLFGGIMESLSVSLIFPLIEAVMNQETWREPFYAQIICGTFHIDSQRSYIQILLVLLIGIFIVKNVYLLWEYHIQYSFAAKSRFRMQSKLMHSYIWKPYTFFLNSSTGEIVRIITGDTVQAFNALTNVMGFYTEMVVSVILVAVMIGISPIIAVGLGIILSIEMVAIMGTLKSILQHIGAKMRSELAISNKWILQAVNGIKSIKVASREDFFERKYNEHVSVAVDNERKYQTLANAPRLLIEAFTVSGVLFIILLMVLMGTDLADIVPRLSAVAVAGVRILPSINRISSAYSSAVYNEGAVDNILCILEEKEQKTEKEQYKADCKKKKRIEFKEKLSLQDVTFSYPDTEQKILDAASLVIQPGQSVGVVGTSGAGKTTMVDIILGLLKPQYGQVLADGVDIEDNMPEWLSHIAYIPQNIFLMDDTIRNNVAFGYDAKEIKDSLVWEALREAQLEEFIMSLPEKLDTRVGEAGIRLSGGQRQRVGIARALYNNPDILFFDEATSALDNETEAAIMASITHLKGKKTLLIIAHRLTTIENCDVVYRVENGKVKKEKET